MTAGGAAASRGDLDRAQGRTLRVLVLAQALGGLGTTIGIAVASILAEELSGSATLAGAAQTMQVLGAAAAAYAIARLSDLRGRRVGLGTGYLVGAAGAGLCVVAGVVGSFGLLLVGALLLGANSATGYQSRYAATDLARPDARSRALGVVLWATTVGAVLGPNLVGPAGEAAASWGLPVLTGPFLFSVLATLLGALVVTGLLRPDPLLLARAYAGGPPEHPPGGTAWRRAVAVGRSHPPVAAAVLALSTAHAVMVAVMVMTPLHMHHGGADLQVIGLVVSVHVLGMFFFSPLVGLVADRVGRGPVLVLGAGLLMAAVALAGASPEGASTRITAGLFLLGLGWSCCVVAGSALLVDATPEAARPEVQGSADMVMNLSAAVAGGLAGVVVGGPGFAALNVLAGVMTLGILVAAAVARRGGSGGAEPDPVV